MKHLPKSFDKLLTSNPEVAKLWNGQSSEADPSARDLELLKAIQPSISVITKQAVVAILTSFAYGKGSEISSKDELDRYAAEVAKQAGLKTIHIRTMEDLAETLPKISFEWEPYLPKGFLTLLLGPPGWGKTYLWLDLVRRLLTGREWPDGQPCDDPDPDACVLWADTESCQAVVLERAEKMGVPLNRLVLPLDDELGDFKIDREDDWQQFCDRAYLLRPRMIVVDSLRGAHQKEEKESGPIQKVMQKGAQLAQELNTVFLYTHHNRKPAGSGDNNQAGFVIHAEDARGSGVIAAMCRSIIGLDKPDPDDPRIRFQVIKNNLREASDPLSFQITNAGVKWFLDAPEETASSQGGMTKLELACSFLQETLWSGSRRETEIQALAEAQDISGASLKRAKKQLGVCSDKSSDGWYWSLPASEVEAEEEGGSASSKPEL